MMIRVVRGNPTPEELAAALAVVQARIRAADAAGAVPVAAPGAAWSAPARVARERLPRPGPRAWSRTYWPR